MIVAGFGFSTQASADSIADAMRQHAVQPDALATLDRKAQALRDMTRATGLPVIAVSQAVAEGQSTQTQSHRSLAETNTPSVAEATALAAAGPGATLIGQRTVSHDRMATCAIAKGPDT